MADNRKLSIDFFAIFAVLIAIWVVAAGVTLFLTSSGYGAWNYFNPFQLAQYAFEALGGVDDDGETGFFITIWILPMFSFALTYMSFQYSRLFHHSLRTSTFALVVSLVALVPALWEILQYYLVSG